MIQEVRVKSVQETLATGQNPGLRHSWVPCSPLQRCSACREGLLWGSSHGTQSKRSAHLLTEHREPSRVDLTYITSLDEKPLPPSALVNIGVSTLCYVQGRMCSHAGSWYENICISVLREHVAVLEDFQIQFIRSVNQRIHLSLFKCPSERLRHSTVYINGRGCLRDKQ